MKKCEECGKKLGIIEGYLHPTLGKKHLLCSQCFNKVSESVEKWKEFVLNNSLNLDNFMEYAKKNGIDFKLINEIVSHAGISSSNKINGNFSKSTIKI